MDLVSPHVKLGPVTINNQAVLINIYKYITNNYSHYIVAYLHTLLLKKYNVCFSLSHFNSVPRIVESYIY